MENEELKHRIDNAIILLNDGQQFKVDELLFSSKDKTHFSVTGWTTCNEIENLTKNKALAELVEIKNIFENMVEASPKLKAFIKDKAIEYCLGYDYGMGGLEICSEIDGKVKWSTILDK